MGVSKNRRGPPKSSILIGFSINKPFHCGVSVFLETPICLFVILLQSFTSQGDFKNIESNIRYVSDLPPETPALLP